MKCSIPPQYTTGRNNVGISIVETTPRGCPFHIPAIPVSQFVPRNLFPTPVGGKQDQILADWLAQYNRLPPYAVLRMKILANQGNIPFWQGLLSISAYLTELCRNYRSLAFLFVQFPGKENL